jgi:hypothetical protein
MTNLERIRQMGAEELAALISQRESLCGTTCHAYDICAEKPELSCVDCWTMWLTAEAKEGQGNV